ncbi:hypothetical protein M3Y97_00261900 [Aphelenchoides bicaudatus]|nr:hypothetical protein M3Y97_00261900 [Aphelenchoides bicaudatus]
MQTCVNCRSTSLRNVDGLFYCEDCGTQNRTLRETAVDDDGDFRVQNMIKVQKPKEDKKKKDENYVYVPTHDVYIGDDFPKHLKYAGMRLATSTSVVVRVSTTLSREFNIPFEVVDASLSLFQDYLAKMGIAFTPGEVATDEEDEYVVDIKKSMRDLIHERREQKQRRKNKKKAEEEAERSKLSKWEQTFLEQTQVEDEEEANDDHLLDIQMIETVRSGVTKNAYELMNHCMMTMDVLLSLIYLACQHVGCNWILLTDLDRWHREDRFKLSGRDMFNLGIVIANAKNANLRGDKGKWRSTNIIFVPNACELYRTLSFVIQNLKIPQTLHLPPFEKVLHRMVFDLNLPACFWTRINLVLSFLPPVKTQLPIAYFKQCCAFMTGNDLISGILHPDRKDANQSCRMLEKKFYPNVTEKRRDLLALIPVETKAAAIIMFTLKLMFALDDSTEYEIDEISSSRFNNFKFTDWLYQTEFRNYARDGTAIENVLSPTFIRKDSLNAETYLRTIAIPGLLCHSLTHKWVTPKRTHYPQTDKPFYHCFSADHVIKSGFETNLAKYSPLRFYGDQGLEIGLSTPNVDNSRREIYLREFNKNEMNFDDIESIGPDDLSSNLAEYDVEWRRMFPGIYKVKNIPNSMHVSFWRAGKPELLMEFIQNRLRDESRTFSKTFERLLITMSMLISERAEVLYLTFSIVESMFANKGLLNEDDRRRKTPTPEPGVDEDMEDLEFDSDDEDPDIDEAPAERNSRRGTNPLFHGIFLRRNELKFVRHVVKTFW